MSDKQDKTLDSSITSAQILADVRNMIEETRTSVSAAVNAGLTILYWRVGKSTFLI